MWFSGLSLDPSHCYSPTRSNNNLKDDTPENLETGAENVDSGGVSADSEETLAADPANSEHNYITYQRKLKNGDLATTQVEQEMVQSVSSSTILPGAVVETIPKGNNLNSDLNADIYLPIAVRKGVWPCTKHPMSQYVSYEKLGPSLQAFTASLDSVSIPQEALQHEQWRRAVSEELEALKRNQTWKVCMLPRGKKIVGCRWVFTVHC